MTSSDDADLLVGFETTDDAAVYRLSDEIAMINTNDFITPPVDAPYWFGQIAAANALSDIYAMGRKPLDPDQILDRPKVEISGFRHVVPETVSGANFQAKNADETHYNLSAR